MSVGDPAWHSAQQQSEIDRLRAEELNDRAVIASTLRRAEHAEAALTRVRAVAEMPLHCYAAGHPYLLPRVVLAAIEGDQA